VTRSLSLKKKSGLVALILGKTGGGKGTISNKMLQNFPMFQHLSSGDVLRHHVKDRTPVGLKAKEFMDSGDLVPDDVMIKLLVEDCKALLEPPDGDSSSAKSLLLDGFPRTLEQAIALEKSMHVDFVINLDIPTDTIVVRLSDRWIHPGSGRVYSYGYKPPKVPEKDDITGEPLEQREDDKPENIRRRLRAYDEATLPMVDYYANKGILKTFAGTKSDVIYINVRQWLEEVMA